MDIGSSPAATAARPTFLPTQTVCGCTKTTILSRNTKERIPRGNICRTDRSWSTIISETAIEKGEHFTTAQGKGIKDALNATARYGLSHLPKSVYVTALKMLLLYHMKPTDAVVLYNRYIGDWGGTSTTYRFEAVSDGGVTAELIKKPMTKVVLFARADHTGLQEKSTYDVAAIRIEARDEYGNLLSFFNEPVSFEVSGPVS